MTPTVRAAALLAAISLTALVAPIWLTVGAALALLAAVGADAWTVRRAPPLQRAVPPALSRGVRTPLTVRAQPGDRRTVALRQPPAPGVAVIDGRGTGNLQAGLLASRRGRHRLPGVASASLGKLGLASVHHRPGAPAELTVYPDLHAARRLVLALRRTRAGHSGRARGPLGLGTELESVREYSVDDDIRQLNWRATARLGRPMSNQYRVERDRDLISVIDCGRLMGARIEERTLLDAALESSPLMALAADEFGIDSARSPSTTPCAGRSRPATAAVRERSRRCSTSRAVRSTPTTSGRSRASDVRAVHRARAYRPGRRRRRPVADRGGLRARPPPRGVRRERRRSGAAVARRTTATSRTRWSRSTSSRPAATPRDGCGRPARSVLEADVQRLSARA